MTLNKLVLLSSLLFIGLSSCEKKGAKCVPGTWRNTENLDSTFYNQIIFEQSGIGQHNIDSEGCDESAFRRNLVFNWSDEDGVLYLEYYDSVRVCGIQPEAINDTIPIAFICEGDQLWLGGTIWTKQ